MKIIGTHLNHDGGMAVVTDGNLTSYIEASKDNQRRYCGMDDLNLGRIFRSLFSGGALPDVLAIGGWHNRNPGYFGYDEKAVSTKFLPIPTMMKEFATTHERAHIFCSYSLSPFPQGEPCYALVYEGTIGSFYRVDEKCVVTKIVTPVKEPGHRYAALFELADSRFPELSKGMSSGSAGKLMALAGNREEFPLNASEEELLHVLLDGEYPSENPPSMVREKRYLQDSPYWNIGHLDTKFRNFAAKFSDALFDRFYSAAKAALNEKLPLLISGGCGLNCGWNTRWRDSGLFKDIFVPPCTDDSGIAIGVAADAQKYYTGNAKLNWNVYCGEPFIEDMPVPQTYECIGLDYEKVVRLLCDGAVVAWVQGNYEIGPRALGNRSLLAAPFRKEMTDRLNHIKKREEYRPVAPVCLKECVSDFFDWSGESPYMLHFQKVRSDKIPAVTHDDGSARVQTVGENENEPLYRLLRTFADKTGVGVLCNTSLNFPGYGFINRTSDLVQYVNDREVDAMVIQNRLYIRRK